MTVSLEQDWSELQANFWVAKLIRLSKNEVFLCNLTVSVLEQKWVSLKRAFLDYRSSRNFKIWLSSQMT